MLGRHSVGTGSAPQNVIGSLVADPLDRAGMKITDIDKFSQRCRIRISQNRQEQEMYRLLTTR